MNNAGFRKPTVLVLEDNADQWFVIRWAFLQKFAEIEPVWMKSPVQAVEYLESCLTSPDGRSMPKFILLDLYFPSYKLGNKLLRWIKEHPVYRQLPVIVLSQSSRPEDIKEAYQHGCNCYIVKPVGYEQWLLYLSQLRQYWWNVTHLPDPLPAR